MLHMNLYFQMLNTPLHYAAKGNHPHSCNELLLGGVNLGVSNINDETAFTIALRSNCNLGKLHNKADVRT